MYPLIPVSHNLVERMAVREPLRQAVQDLLCKRKSFEFSVEFVLVCSRHVVTYT